MNNSRTIVLENVSNQSIGLRDTQGRTYRLLSGARVRISEISLQDILDYPGSRVIFEENLVKVSNVAMDTLYKMGLNEEQIMRYSLDDYSKEVAVVVTEEIEEEVKEEIKEEVVEEVKTTAPKKTTTTKKSTGRKSTKKKK